MKSPFNYPNFYPLFPLKIARLKIPMLPALAAIIFYSGCIIACASVQTDLRYSGEGGAGRIETLESLESDIVSQRDRHDGKELTHIRTRITVLLGEPSTDSAYLARLYALSADVCLLQRQRSEAHKQLTLAKQQNMYDEYVQLVSARLIADPKERIAYLKERLVQNPDYYRLKAELGGLYFAEKDYRNALAAFDASLAFLPEAYRQLYGEQRLQSAQRYTMEPVQSSSEKIVQSDSITLLEMTALTQNSTNALDFITGTAEWKVPLLAKQLQKDGWYHPERDVLKDFASKKDAALFLWRLIAGNDETLLTKYTRYYTNKRKLPIPDVMLDSVYFDAIVGTVEEDVIPLADGKRFEPDNPVNGMEFYRWLLKADELR